MRRSVQRAATFLALSTWSLISTGCVTPPGWAAVAGVDGEGRVVVSAVDCPGEEPVVRTIEVRAGHRSEQVWTYETVDPGAVVSVATTAPSSGPRELSDGTLRLPLIVVGEPPPVGWTGHGPSVDSVTEIDRHPPIDVRFSARWDGDVVARIPDGPATDVYEVTVSSTQRTGVPGEDVPELIRKECDDHGDLDFGGIVLLLAGVSGIGLAGTLVVAVAAALWAHRASTGQARSRGGTSG
jgi:hypothetical protein